LKNLISHPRYKLTKTYYAQVEGAITSEAINNLRRGVKLKDGVTKPAKAKIVDEPSWLWDRNPPIRDRKEIPTSWIELTIREGKNRQVRRMSAAVGFPTLRLIRTSIGPWSLRGIPLGSYQEIKAPKTRDEAERLFSEWKIPSRKRARRR
jgi:23S rRNA pseudouridine2457 synthase